MAESSSMEMITLGGTDTLSPLPPDMKAAVVTSGICGLLSVMSCGGLFLYISYRLFQARRVKERSNSDNRRPRRISRWYGDGPGQARPQRELAEPPPRLSRDIETARHEETARSSNEPEANPFLTLIHHLLVADMMQAAAFLLSLHWWRRDGIFVPSTACGAQSFFVVFGSVANACFLIILSLNTLLTIVWGFRFSRWAIQCMAGVAWAFPLLMAFIGVGANANMPDGDDRRFYARSMSICHMSHRYFPTFGLGIQNFWIILSITVTVVCYAWIATALLRSRQSLRHMPAPAAPAPQHRRTNAPPKLSGHHPAFLVYPAVFCLTSGPLTLIGLLFLGGTRVGLGWFNMGCALSASAGFLDAILWSTTILMSSSRDLEELGMDKYVFMRTPERVYGNMVWVEGAATRPRGEKGPRKDKGGRRGWRLYNDEDSPRGESQDHITGDHMIAGIHMSTITSVKVDHADSAFHPSSDKAPAQHEFHSLH